MHEEYDMTPEDAEVYDPEYENMVFEHESTELIDRVHDMWRLLDSIRKVKTYDKAYLLVRSETRRLARELIALFTKHGETVETDIYDILNED